MRTTPSGLIIPGHLNDEPRYVCNVPSCDWHGYSQQEQVRHALTHANDEDLMAELTYSPVDEVMGEGDPEYMDYLKRKHRQLQKEVGPKEALNPERY